MAEVLEAVREGNRWLNGQPPAEEVASWFAANVKLHEGLEHENYVSGLVLIGQTEKYKVGVELEDGSTDIVEHKRMVYTPYGKVETRLLYWWEWLRLEREKSELDLLGLIEPVAGNEGLKGVPGSFRYEVQTRVGGNDGVTSFVGVTLQCSVYERDARTGHKGKLYKQGSPGSKIVPVLTSNGYADENAVMKAQTGAVGRALGMMGMLVIPGSGVATYEDVMDAVYGGTFEQPAGGSAGASLPADAPAAEQPTDLKVEIAGMLRDLEERSPEKLAEVSEWMKGRKLPPSPSELTDQQARGVHRRLTNVLAALSAEDAEAAAAEPPEPEAEPSSGD